MYRKIRGDAMEAYKYLHGIYKVDCSELLKLYEQGSMSIRGHCLKLKKRGCKTQLRQNFCGNRIVNVWNSLPTEVVTASTVNYCLKERFNRCCKLYSICWDNMSKAEWMDSFLSTWRSVYRRFAYSTKWWWWWCHRPAWRRQGRRQRTTSAKHLSAGKWWERLRRTVLHSVELIECPSNGTKNTTYEPALCWRLITPRTYNWATK